MSCCAPEATAPTVPPDAHPERILSGIGSSIEVVEQARRCLKVGSFKSFGEPTMFHPEHERALAEAGHSLPAPDARLIAAADRESVRAALERLPIAYRETLVLREVEGLSYKEIGAITDVPIGTVMSRLSRARRLLKQNFSREYEHSDSYPSIPIQLGNACGMQPTY